MVEKEYKNPAATASLVIERNRSVYLIERKHNPYAGMWALPGGFLNCDKETLEEAGVRELAEETPFSANLGDLELLCVHSEPDRDPRGHVIDHVYVVKRYQDCPHSDGDYDDAAKGRFFPLDNLPKLAFDHGKAIEKYKTWRIKNDK